jgi:hypothetical protein
MQIPMPQSGERGSPVTDRRQGWPAIIIAAATLVSSETCTDRPFTMMEKLSLMLMKLWLWQRNATRDAFAQIANVDRTGNAVPDRQLLSNAI